MTISTSCWSTNTSTCTTSTTSTATTPWSQVTIDIPTGISMRLSSTGMPISPTSIIGTSIE